MKKLAESDSDDESAAAWVKKSRALAKEKELAEKKVMGGGLACTSWGEKNFSKSYLCKPSLMTKTCILRHLAI